MSTTPAAPPSTPGHPALARRFLHTLRGLLLWRHERGSWQYDVMCVLILVFVFGSPRAWFRDLPLTSAEDGIQILRKVGDTSWYRIRASLLWQYGEQPEAAAHALLTQRHGKPFTITSIVPVEDELGAVVWYDVWLREERK